MKKETIVENGTERQITFITASECKNKSNKQLLNLLRNNDIRNIRESGCCQEGCQNRGGRGTMRAVLAVGKGHGFRYLCSVHYGLNGLKSYHNNTADITYIGSKKNTNLASTTIGVEFEVILKDIKKDIALLNIFRTSLANYASARQEEDSTVMAEFPTGAFEGINSLSKLLDSFERYGVLALTNNASCGAHIHAGCICIKYIRENYKALFEPLAYHIANLSQNDKIRYFGSDFRTWATYPEWYNPQNHTNMFNTQHSNTLEFRLPRCITAKQYLQCCKAWRAVVCEINTHYTEETAEAIGRRLPEVFQKYYNFMNDYCHFDWQ